MVILGHEILEPDDYAGLFEPLYNAATVGKKSLLNLPLAFDIEASSFRDSSGLKRATMYMWQFAADENVTVGRTWAQFVQLISALNNTLEELQTTAIVWVHNLGYEFQWIRHLLHFDKVFAIGSREPVYGWVGRVQFRCSYKESGYSLRKIGLDLDDPEIRKRVGDLDYRLVRHSETPLTQKELEYGVADVIVLSRYIKGKIKQLGGLDQVLLTKTAYVRQDMREYCFDEKNQRPGEASYRNRIRRMTMTPEEYLLLRRAFAGGFTHAAPFSVNQTLHNVASRDISSSYPTTILTETFPMSTGWKVEVNSREQFEELLTRYHMVFDVHFKGLKAKVDYDYPISSSKCWHVEDGNVIKGTQGRVVTYNGRVAEADDLYTSITNIDFSYIEAFYTWDSMAVGNCWVYQRGYLPRQFVERMLYYYKLKTEYKDVKGKEAEYLWAKENLNSLYGMMVMDIVRGEFGVDDDGYWNDELNPEEVFESNQPNDEDFFYDLSTKIKRYNNNRTRFLCYVWGVFVTSYARRNLFLSIMEAGFDHVYADTDSDKILHPEEHAAFYERYNKNIAEKCDRACKYHGIDPELSRPKTPKGVQKQLGIFDKDGEYVTFKTLGAKRYLATEYNKLGECVLHSTVAGVSKSGLPQYLAPDKIVVTRDDYDVIVDEYAVVDPEDMRPFDKFTDEMVVPASYSGKLTHTYIDEPTEGDIVDYLGIPGHYSELSSIHLEETDYDMSPIGELLSFAATIQRKTW